MKEERSTTTRETRRGQVSSERNDGSDSPAGEATTKMRVGNGAETAKIKGHVDAFMDGLTKEEYIELGVALDIALALAPP
ncbi:hypothetical protein JCM10213v2_006002 [Rhodosporidiobolus nylandii]